MVFVSLILFSAPVVLLAARPPPRQLMLAFFVPWLVSLAVLFVASRGYQASSGEDDRRPETPGALTCFAPPPSS